MDQRTAMTIRGLAARAVIRGISDSGEAQTVEAETHEGVLRSGVEVLQPFGFASVPPADGAIAVLLAVGGDQGDMVALPAAAPSARFGNLAAGESVIHDAAGNRLHFRAGGLVEIQAATSMLVKVAGTEFLVGEDGVTVTGNLTVNGDIVATGQVSDGAGSMQEMRDKYNAHGHPDASAPPGPLMD